MIHFLLTLHFITILLLCAIGVIFSAENTRKYFVSSVFLAILTGTIFGMEVLMFTALNSLL